MRGEGRYRLDPVLPEPVSTPLRLDEPPPDELPDPPPDEPLLEPLDPAPVDGVD